MKHTSITVNEKCPKCDREANSTSDPAYTGCHRCNIFWPVGENRNDGGKDVSKKV